MNWFYPEDGFLPHPDEKVLAYIKLPDSGTQKKHKKVFASAKVSANGVWRLVGITDYIIEGMFDKKIALVERWTYDNE